jgi:hypothetical protein
VVWFAVRLETNATVAAASLSEAAALPTVAIGGSGYHASILAEESRLLEISIFKTLQDDFASTATPCYCSASW